jgi:putative Holliday junction resolvase
MTVCNPTELPEMLRQNQRLLGIDLGEKTIGLALSDPGRIIASPFVTLRRTRFSKDVKTLRALMDEYGIGAIVIGLPFNMDGSEGSRCQSVRQFADNLLEKMDIPIAFWDERLSTVAVTRTLLEADMSRKRRDEVVDKMAAAYILQGALDRMKETP